MFSPFDERGQRLLSWLLDAGELVAEVNFELMPRIISSGGILRRAVILKRAEAFGPDRIWLVSLKGSISVAVVRGFELPKQGRQMILPGEGAEQQRLNLARSMLLATPVAIGARVGRMGLPFSAIDHSRPVERDACGLVGSEVGRKNLLPLHIRGTGVLGPERLVDPRVVVFDERGVRRHAVTGGVDGLSDRCGSAGGGPVDGRSARLGCLVPLDVGPGMFVLF